MENKNITQKIIGCAYKVYNTLGFGYLESVYEKSLLIELRNSGLQAQSQVPVKVRYQGVIVGDFYADILVNDEIIIELKSIKKLSKIHEAQLVNYLVATGKDIGLLINFSQEQVEVKRKVRVLPKANEKNQMK